MKTYIPTAYRVTAAKRIQSINLRSRYTRVYGLFLTRPVLSLGLPSGDSCWSTRTDFIVVNRKQKLPVETSSAMLRRICARDQTETRVRRCAFFPATCSLSHNARLFFLPEYGRDNCSFRFVRGCHKPFHFSMILLRNDSSLHSRTV